MDPSGVQKIKNEPLAFSSDPSLLPATSRLVLETDDGNLLNIELFEYSVESPSAPQSPLLLFVPGVCESAETTTVQNLVAEAKERQIRVAVLELQGHGLSTGERCVTRDFDKLVHHVVEFVQFTIEHFEEKNKKVNDGVKGSSKFIALPYFLCGASLGGVLAAYAAEILSNENEDNITGSSFSSFKGVATLAPAVGVNPIAIPPTVIVKCLTYLAYLAPAMQTPLTPLEDPTHYNCPKDTRRNFAGNWPLATSKMLLDVTSFKVKNDLMTGTLSLENVRHVFIVAGEKDLAVPFDSIKHFHESVQATNKHFMRVPKAGHDLMCNESSSALVNKALYDWISNSLNNM